MSESSQASVGQILRDARAAQGIALDDAAARLRLMHRQIEAMEADDFESLGQPVFARGFVRNYARLLGLAPEVLLARMQGAPAEPAAVSPADQPVSHSWLTSPWLMLSLLGLVAAVAVPVVLYLWLNSGVEDGSADRGPVVAQTQAARVAAPAPVAESAEAVPPVVEAAPAEPAASTEPAAAAAPATPAPAAGSVLHLEFGDEAWTEIKDASGRMLHRQLNPAGGSVDVHGQPPFDVVIGNAAQARMTYNGRPIDLTPFIDATVARFTLEE